LAAQDLANMNPRYGKQVDQVNARRRKPPSSRMKRLTLDLHEPLHRAIKKNAAEDGVTMAQKLRALLSKHYRTSEETS
jgi:predicted DNA binding CopG/RHH family protein